MRVEIKFVYKTDKKDKEQALEEALEALKQNLEHKAGFEVQYMRNYKPRENQAQAA